VEVEGGRRNSKDCKKLATVSVRALAICTLAAGTYVYLCVCVCMCVCVCVHLCIHIHERADVCISMQVCRLM